MISSIADIGTTTGSSALGTVIPFAGAAATGIIQAIHSAPHNIANIVVQQVENPFGQKLAQAAAIRETDPDQARQILTQAYADYNAGLDAVRQAGTLGPGGQPISKVQDVINQSLNNPALWQTVNTLSGQLGLQVSNGQMVPVSTNTSGTSGTPGTSGTSDINSFTTGDNNPGIESPDSSLLSTIISALPNYAQAGVLGGNPNSGTLPGMIPGTNGSPSLPGSTGPAQTAAKPTASKSIFDSILPAILLGTSVGANIYSADKTSNAATNAAQIQADATTKAAQLSADTANKALDLNQQQFNTNQANIAPWLATGTSAVNELGSRLGISGDPNAPNYGSLTKPFGETFSFTADDLLKDPGYLNRLNAADQAMQRSAAAKGNTFTPGTQAAIAGKEGELASNEFQTAHDRALNDFLSKYNIYNTDQSNLFNRLSGVAGTGQTATGQVQSAGNTATSNAINTSTNSTNQINDLNTSGASATAQGVVNANKANVGGVTNSIDDITSYIAQLLRQRNPSVYATA